MVTRKMVCDWLLAYLNGEVERQTLVEWARQVRRSGEVFAHDAGVVGPALARIGLAGVGGYDLTWDDCFDLIESLGFAPRVVADPIGPDDDADEADDAGGPEEDAEYW